MRDVLSYFEWHSYGVDVGEAVWETGHGLPERAMPTAPKVFTEPLKTSVYSHRVTKGVDDAKRPSFGT